MAGILLIHDPTQAPDILVYYCHGGGFSMGSSYFYLEFLLAWVSLLQTRAGYANPALFTLEYTLVLKATHPTQLNQTFAGYIYVLSLLPTATSTSTISSIRTDADVKIPDTSRICLAGDSAGATLMLSLLLRITQDPSYRHLRPGLATMISPWCRLVSDKNQNTRSDYLNVQSLHLYARQYVGSTFSTNTKSNNNREVHDNETSLHDPLASPGACKDLETWRQASPTRGYHFVFGAEEVFAPETREMVAVLRKAGIEVEVTEEKGQVHAWAVVALFLGETSEGRLKGLSVIVEVMRRKMGQR